MFYITLALVFMGALMIVLGLFDTLIFGVGPFGICLPIGSALIFIATYTAEKV